MQRKGFRPLYTRTSWLWRTLGYAPGREDRAAGVSPCGTLDSRLFTMDTSMSPRTR